MSARYATQVFCVVGKLLLLTTGDNSKNLDEDFRRFSK